MIIRNHQTHKYIHNMAHVLFAVGTYLAYQWWTVPDKKEMERLKEQKKRAQELKKQKEEEIMNKLNENVQNLNNDAIRRLHENFKDLLSYRTAEEEIQYEISQTENNFYSWFSNQIFTIGINMVILRFNGSINLAERALTLLSNQCAFRGIRQGLQYFGMTPSRRRLRNN